MLSLNGESKCKMLRAPASSMVIAKSSLESEVISITISLSIVKVRMRGIQQGVVLAAFMMNVDNKISTTVSTDIVILLKCIMIKRL